MSNKCRSLEYYNNKRIMKNIDYIEARLNLIIKNTMYTIMNDKYYLFLGIGKEYNVITYDIKISFIFNKSESKINTELELIHGAEIIISKRDEQILLHTGKKLKNNYFVFDMLTEETPLIFKPNTGSTFNAYLKIEISEN